jgi:hypothetical protein
MDAMTGPAGQGTDPCVDAYPLILSVLSSQPKAACPGRDLNPHAPKDSGV